MFTYITEITGLAHTPRDWILHRTPSIKRAIILTIFDAAVIADEWGRTIGLAEPVTYTVDLPRTFSSARELISVLNIVVHVLVPISSGACMHAHLVVGILVVIAHGARARSIRAIFPIVTYIAETKAVLTQTSITTVIDTMI